MSDGRCPTCNGAPSRLLRDLATEMGQEDAELPSLRARLASAEARLETVLPLLGRKQEALEAAEAANARLRAVEAAAREMKVKRTIYEQLRNNWRTVTEAALEGGYRDLRAAWETLDAALARVTP